MKYYLGILLLTLSVTTKAVVLGPVGNIKACETDDGRRHTLGTLIEKFISE